jgi:hypothetical protein
VRMKVRMNAGDQNRTSAMAAPAADGGMARSTISMRSDGRAAAQQTQRSESCAQLPACDCQHLISGLGSIQSLYLHQNPPGRPRNPRPAALSATVHIPRAGPRFPFAAESAGNGDSLFPARFPIPVNRETGFTGSPFPEKKSGNRGTRFQSALSPTPSRSRESDSLSASDEHQLRLPVQLSRVPRGPWARPQAGAQAT